MRGLFMITATVVLLLAGVAQAQESEGSVQADQSVQGGNSQRPGGERHENTGDVRGFVTDGDGNPVANAEIFFKTDEDSEENVAEAESELDGSFRMEDIEAGVYVVVVGKRGFEALIQKGVPVIAGQEIELRLVVESLVLGTAPPGRSRR